MIEYLLIILFLVILLHLYFIIALKHKIIDKPNERSSHSNITIRGGGILFPIAILIWSFITGIFNLFTIGLILISVISFVDDCKPLSNKIRLSIHFISIFLLMYELGLMNFHVSYLFFGFLFIGGWINAYNFMDGINGITVLYSLSVLLACFYINSQISFVDKSLLEYTAISLVVFGFFNVRKKAKVFAGDVGSVSLAFIIAFIIISLVLETLNWQYILLVSVYGVETLTTIIQRLLKKENIFKAHRSHLYQYLANEVKWPQLKVSFIFAIIQLLLNIFLISIIIPMRSSLLAVSYLTAQGLLYLIIKYFVIRKIQLK
jgi:UDP-GlcNAc:undecaprenyl-phosphate/decaprenyl-phosphate GlcNAc-1-phosphate transferase